MQVRAFMGQPWFCWTGYGVDVNLVLLPGIERIDVPYSVVVEGPYTKLEKSWCCNASFRDGKVTAELSELWKV